ncbi:hypothetical protein BX616_002020 [Lobosporangium transversale]|uniref:Chromo domain-containing protein n=1 Tax=Lobosporangium transversale TaxID=64571 RepID=A0A1Y2GA78_9FUNG|nr:hypothetical protein BCR41DRAFT_425633 [Lobosporangium transversale]KAF9902164.1 hypothetical protein BX616_002020 [Lobosporangium transversale]ORZ05170.1 hypothetical protein BCR41DRAFT_425633 [Lobosporangium transversale]|eukprot:XP_021876945.1 hypothetical protein BCR41DRAFT_425633 [Lobosporangium transversale]
MTDANVMDIDRTTDSVNVKISAFKTTTTSITETAAETVEASSDSSSEADFTQEVNVPHDNLPGQEQKNGNPEEQSTLAFEETSHPQKRRSSDYTDIPENPDQMISQAIVSIANRRAKKPVSYAPVYNKSAAPSSLGSKKATSKQDHIRTIIGAILPEGTVATEEALDRLSLAFNALVKETSDASASKVATSVKAAVTTVASKAAAAAAAAVTPASTSVPKSTVPHSPPSSPSTSSSNTRSKSKRTSPLSPIPVDHSERIFTHALPRRSSTTIISRKPHAVDVAVKTGSKRHSETDNKLTKRQKSTKREGEDEENKEKTSKKDKEYEENNNDEEEEEEEEEESEYEVEAILDYKALRGKKHKFLIKWVGYPENESTWESQDALTGCDEMLHAFAVKKGITL